MPRRLSRRDFLKYMGLAAGGGALAACAPRPTPTAVPIAAAGQPPTPHAQICATPEPEPIPPPTTVQTNLDLATYYIHFRNEPDVPRNVPGYETIEPFYGAGQSPRTMQIDIKWARECGIGTFLMPAMFPDSPPEIRLQNWFQPASQPPFEMNYAIMFNPNFDPATPTQDVLDAQIANLRDLFARHLANPRYKRLPDGRPVVIYYAASLIAYFLGMKRMGQSADLLRSILPSNTFLIGDVMIEPLAVRTDPKYSATERVAGSVKPFDGITSYYMALAGYEWHSGYDYNHVVTPFGDMVKGYEEAFQFWGEQAGKYKVKMVPAPMPAGVSNKLLYDAGVDSWLWDRHAGLTYDNSKAMAELGAKYADPELKMVIIAAWNECSEGAAVIPSVGYKFDPVHAIRDTYAIRPANGWPQDYVPPSPWG